MNPVYAPEVQTRHLSGAALDYFAAQIEGVDVSQGLTDDERYSTRPELAYPIILRENIRVGPEMVVGHTESQREIVHYTGLWRADADYNPQLCRFRYSVTGITPLEAAMRCHVLRRIGERVILPPNLPKD